MAGKKGAAIQLQQEVNTDEDWAEMIKKPGLTVVDVYSAWCGPCVGMVGNLKKVKLEIGGDLLHLAIAKADTITCLSRFRNKSEPTWMFISNGKMVNLMFGANAPRLIKLMTEEIQKEGDYQRGQVERYGIDFEELTPEEQERAELDKAREAEANAAKEAVLNEEREKRRQKVIRKLVREMKYDSVVLFLPFLKDPETSTWSAYDKLIGILGSEFSTKREVLVELTLEDAEKLFGVYDEDLAEELDRILKLGPCLAKIIGLPSKEPVEETEQDEELQEIEEPVVEEPPEDGEEGEEQPEIHATEAIYYAVYGSSGPPNMETIREEEEGVKPSGEEEDEEDEDEEEGEMSLLTQLFHQYAEITSLPALWAPLTEEQKAEAVILLFPTYIEELIGPEPPPPPPHLAVIFDANKYPELTETLEEYADDIIRSGFFDGPNPETAKKVATSFNEYLLSKKTGNEKFVLMMNNSKSDSVLALAQLSPIYVSLNQDDGKEDCGKFFPDDEEEQQEIEVAVEEPEKAGKAAAEAEGAPRPKAPPPQQAVEVLMVETVAATGEGQAAAIMDETLAKTPGPAPRGEAGPADEAVEAIVEKAAGEGAPAETAVQEAVQDAAQEPGEAAATQAADTAAQQADVAPPPPPAEQAADQAADQVADQMADQAADKVADQAADQVADQAADKVADQTADLAADLAADQVADQAADQVAGQVTEVAVDQVAEVAADQATEVAAEVAAEGATEGVFGAPAEGEAPPAEAEGG